MCLSRCGRVILYKSMLNLLDFANIKFFQKSNFHFPHFFIYSHPWHRTKHSTYWWWGRMYFSQGRLVRGRLFSSIASSVMHMSMRYLLPSLHRRGLPRRILAGWQCIHGVDSGYVIHSLTMRSRISYRESIWWRDSSRPIYSSSMRYLCCLGVFLPIWIG